MKLFNFAFLFLLLLGNINLNAQAYNIYYDVPIVGQQTGVSCWAASTAMVIGWGNQQSIDPHTIAQEIGYEEQYTQVGLAADDFEAFRHWGLTANGAQCYGPADLAHLLIQNGPLWVAILEGGQSPHAKVVTGIYGDGTMDGTWVYINDPDDASGNYPNPGIQYQETFAQFYSKMFNLAEMELRTLDGAYYIAYLSH